MTRQVSVVALVMGVWALSGSPATLAYAEEVDRSSSSVELFREADVTDLDRGDKTPTDQMGQDNINIVPPGAGDIELVIKLLQDLGDDGFRPLPNKPQSPSDLKLHRLADDIIAAYEANNTRLVLKLIQKDAEVRTLRPEVNVLEAWSLHKVGRTSEALAAFERLYAQERSPGHASGILYSGLRGERFSKVYALAEPDTGPLGQILVHGRDDGLDPGTRAEIRKVRIDFLRTWLAAALKYNQDYTARRVTALLAQEGVRPDVGPQLVAAGWRAHNRKDYDEALRLFSAAEGAGGLTPEKSLEVQFGRALALHSQGDDAGALKIASLYAAKHNGLKELKASLESEATPQVQAAMVPDAPPTDLQDLQRQPESNGTTTEVETPVYQMSKAERATYRGHFLTAATTDPNAYGQLSEVGTSWIGDTLRVQHRDGDKGLSELTLLSGKVGGAWTHDLSHFKVEVEFLNLDAGGAHDGSRPVGTWQPGDGPTPFTFPEDEEVIVPRLTWWREGDTSLRLELGTSPMGGAVDETITGLASATFHTGAAATSLSIYRQPVYESILSASGGIDPVTGEEFGGIVETGIQASYFGPIADQWYLSATASSGERRGENVLDNRHTKAEVSLAYSLAREGFSYVSFGPSYRFESYEHNQSHFTFGHGGYYSPESLHNAGFALNFMTEEGLNSLVKGGFNVGYQKAEQEDAPYYPLLPGPHADVHSGSEASGVGVSGQVQGVWRLSDRWMFEAGVYGQHNDDFSEYAGFLKLRFSFGARNSTYSSDFTEPLYRRW